MFPERHDQSDDQAASGPEKAGGQEFLADGFEDDIKWFFKELDNRFACKGDEWLSPKNSLDFLGIEVSMDQERLYLTMVDFTEKTLKAMDMEECPIASRPIVQEIIDMEPLAQSRLDAKVHDRCWVCGLVSQHSEARHRVRAFKDFSTHGKTRPRRL